MVSVEDSVSFDEANFTLRSRSLIYNQEQMFNFEISDFKRVINES